MKYIFNKSAYLICLLLLLVSCELDDIGTPGLVPDDVGLTNNSQLRTAVSTVYNSFGAKNKVQFNSVFTDEIAKGFANGGQGVNDPGYYFLINPTEGTVSSFWVGNISAINFANRAIMAGESFVNDNNADELERLDLIAQAKALRAYAYLELVTYFSTDMTSESALGPILFTDIYSEDVAIPRATNGDVYSLIEDDIEYAETNLQEESNIFYVSQDFIRALKIRKNSYKGTYTDVINDVDAYFPDSELASASQYPNIWTDGSNEDIIFKFKRVLNDTYSSQSGWMGNAYASVDATVNGSPFFEMSRSLYNEYASISGDVRLSSFLAPSSVIDPNYQSSTDYLNSDKLVISKYPGNGVQVLMNDVKVFRVSEMQLLKAEAQIYANDLLGAALTIQTLRNKRFTTPQPLPVYASSQEAYQDLLLERRKELAFEGFRYVDIKRLGSLANVSFDRDPMDAALFSAPLTLDLSSHYFTLPIPQSEINGNPGLTSSDQNPGY